MRFKKFIPPLLIILLTLTGTYYVRLRILEKQMSTSAVGQTQ